MTIDDDICPEEILKKIRARVNKRQEHEAYRDPVTLSLSAKLDLCDVKRDLNYINANWDIYNSSYAISSHRPVVGIFLVKGRELVNGELRRYIDPALLKQSLINAAVFRTIESLDKQQAKMITLEANLLDSQLEAAKEFEVLREDIETIKGEVQEDIKDRVRAVVTAMNEEIVARASLLKVLEKRVNETPIDTAEGSYFVFEERFRGSREEIMKRQPVFLKHFSGCKNVLDIGCGRGEFLELLKKERIGTCGIDIDEDMVNYCLSRGLNVERIDAISYLEKIEDKCLDGIFLDQVVEHMEPEYLMKMLRLSHQKMIYGSYIVTETVNPLSFTSFANFYIDISHKKPLHPQTLSYLLESAGFREISIEFHSPLPDYAKLESIPSKECEDEKIISILNAYNRNIDKLNRILYGPQDYVVIGKKVRV